jgi:hypothetical protein
VFIDCIAAGPTAGRDILDGKQDISWLFLLMHLSRLTVHPISIIPRSTIYPNKINEIERQCINGQMMLQMTGFFLPIKRRVPSKNPSERNK